MFVHIWLTEKLKPGRLMKGTGGIRRRLKKGASRKRTSRPEKRRARETRRPTRTASVLRGESSKGAARDPKSAPLYLQVSSRIIASIQKGDFPVGSLLPTELKLASLHGVSRQTVSHAISELRQKGLVSARKGVGTRVELVRAARRFDYSAQSVADLFNFASATEMTVRKRTTVVARGPLAARLGCRSGHRWLHLDCRRTIINQTSPLCWTDIFIDGRLASVVRNHRIFRSAIFALIERETGETVVEIQQEIRAVRLATKWPTGWMRSDRARRCRSRGVISAQGAVSFRCR